MSFFLVEIHPQDKDELPYFTVGSCLILIQRIAPSTCSHDNRWRWPAGHEKLTFMLMISPQSKGAFDEKDSLAAGQFIFLF